MQLRLWEPGLHSDGFRVAGDGTVHLNAEARNGAALPAFGVFRKFGIRRDESVVPKLFRPDVVRVLGAHLRSIAYRMPALQSIFPFQSALNFTSQCSLANTKPPRKSWIQETLNSDHRAR